MQSNSGVKKRITKKDKEAIIRIKEGLDEIHTLIRGVCVVSSSKYPKRIHSKLDKFIIGKSKNI